MSSFVIAQFNIARYIAPLDDPVLADFFAFRDEIDKLAEDSPGFIWRLVDVDDADPSGGLYDPAVAINLSVWENIESLRQYTYYTAHADMFRRRAEWFSKLGAPSFALWWIERGHLPTLSEAKARLDHLQMHGATPFAFTFKRRFPAPCDDETRP